VEKSPAASQVEHVEKAGRANPKGKRFRTKWWRHGERGTVETNSTPPGELQKQAGRQCREGLSTYLGRVSGLMGMQNGEVKEDLR